VNARLAAVTRDEVNAVARKYLGADNRTIGIFEPTIGADGEAR
jgi:predicted Zn-dependent peptidase